MEARTTVVTGAAQGIGRAIAERLAADGQTVIGCDIKDGGNDFPGTMVRVDLTDADAAKDCMADIAGHYAVDHLVNNAGAVFPQLMEDTDLESFQKAIDLNLRAALITAQAFTPAMRAKGRGRIVNISSRAVTGKAIRTSYAAAKAGLMAFTRTWALELGRDGITVNCIGPGPIATELFNSANPPDSPVTQEIRASIPVGRMGEPREIAGTVAFFLSDDAAFITGQTLFVCGGMTVGRAPI
ncbi:MAG: short-chain dehydrogenase [Rhodospirillaceae bacterium]|nr:short-chain dehydrogenase [Rhodospirillaceae bacterium]